MEFESESVGVGEGMASSVDWARVVGRDRENKTSSKERGLLQRMFLLLRW